MISFDDHMQQAASEYITHVLIVCGWNVARAARMSGRCRGDFYRLMQRHGITRPRPSARARRGQWHRSIEHLSASNQQ